MESKGSNISEFKVGELITRVSPVIYPKLDNYSDYSYIGFPLEYLGIHNNKIKVRCLEWPDKLLGEFNLALGKGWENGWERYSKPVREESELIKKAKETFNKDFVKEMEIRKNVNTLREMENIYDAVNGHNQDYEKFSLN